MALRAQSLIPDGAVELDLARALAEGRGHDALATAFPPLFALLVAPLVSLGCDAERAAGVVAVLVSSLAAPLGALAAAELAPRSPRRAAWLGGLLAATHPWLVRLGGQVVAYGAAHAALALAVLLTLRAARAGTARSGFLAGAAIGLGWLARADALTTGAGLALGLVVALRRRAVRPALALALGALLVMSPYLAAMRLHAGEWRLSLKKRALDLVDVRLTARAPSAPRAPSLEQLIAAENVGEEDPTGGRLPLPAAVLYAVRKGWSAATPLALVALVGLWLSPIRGRAAPGLALAGFVAGHALLKAGAGYTSALHMSALGVIVAPLAAVALARARYDRARTLGVAFVCLVALLVKGLEAPQRGKAIEREVGPWLRAQAGPGPLLVAGRDARVVAHDAGAEYVDLRDAPGAPAVALRALAARGARFVVVFLRRKAVPEGERAPPPLEEALREGGFALARRFASQGDGGVRYDWLVFRLERRP